MGLDLKSGDIIFLDTAPFIYFFEQHPDYFPGLELFFNQLRPRFHLCLRHLLDNRVHLH